MGRETSRHLHQSWETQAVPQRGLRVRPGARCTPRSRVWHLPPDGFRVLRGSRLLSRKACADLPKRSGLAG
jgi:hypothetical protein